MKEYDYMVTTDTTEQTCKTLAEARKVAKENKPSMIHRWIWNPDIEDYEYDESFTLISYE